jgi:hypothetical protein
MNQQAMLKRYPVSRINYILHLQCFGVAPLSRLISVPTLVPLSADESNLLPTLG